MDYSQLGKRRNIRKQNPHTARIRNKVGLLSLRITLGLLLVAGFALLGGGFGLYFGILNNAPALQLDMVVPVYRSSVIIDAHTGEELHRLHGGHNHESVTIDQIPLHVQHAFIAIEDERFFEHNGIDIRGIGRAAHRLVSSGGAVTEGASTITQQLIKNMLGRFDSNFVYKLQEQYLAVHFERFLTEEFGSRQLAKEFILESYLNIINLGRQNYGVQSAALFYYNVNVWELTIAQAATIAAITQNPSRFPPDTRPEANWVRAQHVLDSMLRLGFITEEEHYEAINSDVYATIYRTSAGYTRPLISPFDCFTDALLDSVRDDLMRVHNLTLEMANRHLFTGGLRIYTTQNQEMQRVVDRVFLDDFYWPESEFTLDVEFNFTLYNTITGISRHFQRRRTVPNMEAAEAWMEEVRNQYMTSQDTITREQALFTPQPQAAFVLLDHHTGHVLALRGVRGERGTNRSFNRATQATRQPGSQLKTIGIFGPAYDLGIMQPATAIEDRPFTLVQAGSEPWSPANWWSGFRGFMTTRHAVYNSANVVSARAVADVNIPHVGVDTMFSYLRNMGITTIVDGADGAAVSLGGMNQGVRLIELAGAYGMVANGGLFNPPVLYSLVLDYYGAVVLENPVNPTRVFRDTAAYLLMHTMRDTMTVGTGTQANWSSASGLRGSIAVGGKTGTTQQNRDFGFSGSTPYLTASIWIGNDSNARMTNAARVHLPAWRSIMEEIHREFAPRQFERPQGIVTATVCAITGLLPAPGGPTRTDIFDARFVPTEVCTMNLSITYCEVHGYLAGPYCPPSALVTRSGAPTADSPGAFPQGVIDGIECMRHTPEDLANYWAAQQTPGYDPNLPDHIEIPTGVAPPLTTQPPTEPTTSPWGDHDFGDGPTMQLPPNLPDIELPTLPPDPTEPDTWIPDPEPDDNDEPPYGF